MIQGLATPKFSRVKEVFQENFKKRNEVGAACAVYYQGHKVVDLWGGYRDKDKKELWEKNTMCLIFSTSKAISAVVIAKLHSEGLLDYDKEISYYWKGFEKNGKGNITVKQLLNHEAGLEGITSAIITPDILQDFDRFAKILENEKPNPKTYGKKAYHTWTIGFYSNELVRRIDSRKRTIAEYFHQEIAQPLELNRIFLGLPETVAGEEVAKMIFHNPLDALINPAYDNNFDLVFNAFTNPLTVFPSFANPPIVLFLPYFNLRYGRSLQIASGTFFSTARDLAKLFHEMAIHSPNLGINENTFKLIETQSNGSNFNKKDMVLSKVLNYNLGFNKPTSFFKFGVNERSYGHQGAGGSVIICDPESKLSFSYVMNKMGTNVANDPREKALYEAVMSCI
jgi:CubicO group peptidase (beta-lactamase class C family)